MAQSRPFLGRLEPFYGWYIRVGGYFEKTTQKPKTFYLKQKK